MSSPSSGKHMSRNAGSTKWRLHWGNIRGSSLNLGWSKCGIWLVDQWVPTSVCVCLLDCWVHIESSWYHYPWCMLGYCICLRHWHVDYIDWSFRLSSHIDSPCCMITLLTLTCTLFLLLISFTLTWLIHLVVYYFNYHGAYYHCQIFFSINLCVDL